MYVRPYAYDLGEKNVVQGENVNKVKSAPVTTAVSTVFYRWSLTMGLYEVVKVGRYNIQLFQHNVSV